MGSKRMISTAALALVITLLAMCEVRCENNPERILEHHEEMQFWQHYAESMMESIPSTSPTETPSRSPSETPTRSPSISPSEPPSESPTGSPSESPTGFPSETPTTFPTGPPTPSPSSQPSEPPTSQPSNAPSRSPSESPTSPPSSQPSSPPSSPPSSAPSESPSSPPSSAPSESPSSPPSRSPSESPSSPPSKSPSESPSRLPTESPSEPPSGLCIVETFMTCTGENGVECKSLEEPEGQCSVGTNIRIALFQLDFCACPESRNTQEDFVESNCIDVANLPPAGSGQQANVDCSKEDGTVLASATIGEGNTITVIDSSATALPDLIQCQIKDINDNVLQIMRIDTSGTQDFYLNDKFGSLELKACDDKDCFINVDYEYFIENTGQTNADVTSFERIRLTGDPANPTVETAQLTIPDATIPPGQTSSATESDEIDICVDGYYRTEVNIDAVPPDGRPCPAEVNYEFTPTVRCRVDVEIVCETQEGIACEDIVPPGKCTDDDPLTVLRMKYQTCTCEESATTNTQGDRTNCRDISVPPDGEVVIQCVGNTGELLVNQAGVAPGDDILITDASGLPDSTLCTVGDGSSTIYQQIVFDTSGTVDLRLKDKFGSLELEACEDTSGDSLDCLETLCYEYELSNVGTNDMDITLLNRIRNGESANLLDLIIGDETTLVPGQSVTAVEKETIDICLPGEYTTTTIVEADPPDDEMCQDEDTYTFTIEPICDLFVEIDCETQDGNDCSTAVGINTGCRCDNCLTELRYKYTASPCAPGFPNCNDNGAELPSFADITITGGGLTLFGGDVALGSEIVLSRFGSCLPELLQVSVRESFGSLLQTVTVDPTCGETSLLDEFGALQFSGYTCQGDLEATNCFETVEFTVTVTNTGEVTTTVDEWEFALNDETLVTLTDPFDLDPMEDFELTEQVDLNLCEAGDYVATSSVNGMGFNQEDCPHTALPLEFGNTLPPTPAPSSEPSPVPSRTPSAEPSPAPSPTPSSFPSSSPTSSPLVPPSDPPSAAPSVVPTVSTCTFNLDIDCIPPPGSADCNATPPLVTQCEGRPFRMGFLYRGRFCNESFNVQNLDGRELFLCEDLAPQPRQEGERSYIMVWDDKEAILYFEGWVEIGDVFDLFDGGERFTANQIIRIYNSSDTSNQANLLQDMQYHSSCSSNLFLKDRFGGVQLVEWENEDQGEISCFRNQTFELDIEIPIDIMGSTATLTGLTVISNVEPFFFNKTDEVFGRTVLLGQPFQVSIGIELDLTIRRTYNLLITVNAVTDAGRECIATQLTSFTAGNPLPAIFPTLSPTASPTGTDSPTPNPLRTACNLVADIECTTFTGKSCISITPPTTQICNSISPPNSLFFRYTGAGVGNLPAVHFNVVNVDNTEVFDRVVSLGSGLLFANSDGDDSRLDITVSTASGSGPGTLISQFSLDVQCDGGWSLLDNFGPIQLIGFDTREQGLQTTIELITLRFITRNAGELDARVTSISKTSDFTGGPTQLLDFERTLAQAGELSLGTEFVAFPVSDNIGVRYEFSLDVAGVGSSSGVACDDSTQFVFQV